MLQNRNQNHLLLCDVVFDFMVYPDPKFLIFNTKKKTTIVPNLALCTGLIMYCDL